MRIFLICALLSVAACQTVSQIPEDFDPTFEF